MEQSLRHVAAVVVGLGREGAVVARFLSELGAMVTVTDLKPAERLTAGLAALEGLPITYVLGAHPLSVLEGAEIVFVSPGVPLDAPLLVEAKRRGIPLSSETRLFTRLCPAAIIGITGSSGKTTTTALLGEMLKADGRRTWVGGNIGRPLLGHIDEISASDSVAMELSSFQLELFAPWTEGCGGSSSRKPSRDRSLVGLLFDAAGWSPPIAAVLNLSPNHLDRHPDMQAYTAAKEQILTHQKAGDVAVLGFDSPEARMLAQRGPAGRRLLWFSVETEVGEGAFLRDGALVLRVVGREQTVCQRGELKLRGLHNVANVLAACTLAAAAGVSREAMRAVAVSFRGVEHRLELVRELAGVSWYNDSIATTPERAIAAMQAFEGPLVLLAGGRDKHLPWDRMTELAWKRARHLVLFGEAAGLIEEAMLRSPAAASGQCQIHRAANLAQAVALAARVAQPGDVVLLAPGGTSFDAYADFEARGEHFRRLVSELELVSEG